MHTTDWIPLIILAFTVSVLIYQATYWWFNTRKRR